MRVLRNRIKFENLDYFLNPRSVAVVGASSRPGRIGYVILESLSKKFKGSIFPINPKSNSILGIKVYPSINAVDGEIELIVAIIALKNIPDLIEQAAEKGTKAIIIVSAGGKEIGGEYAKQEEKILEKAKKHQIRVIGPNCVGIYHPEIGIDTLFHSYERLQRPNVGHISYGAQSGTFGVAFLEFTEVTGIGIRTFISYGNRIDVDEGDIIAHFAEDQKTKQIGLYIEALGNGRKFVKIAKDITREKPIILYKSGQTEQGAQVAFSHTGWLSQSPKMNEGMFKQAGIVLANSFDQQCAMLKALHYQPPSRGPNVAFITNGAGPVVSAIDQIQETSLKLAELLPKSIEAMKQKFPYYYISQNPVDVTGSATSKDYKIALQVLLNDPSVNLCLVYCVFQDTPLDEGIIDVLANSLPFKKPLLICAIGGSYTRRMSELIEQKGIPVYSSVSDWVAAAKALYIHGKNLQLISKNKFV